MEDVRAGLILRALRLRKGLRQVDIARLAGVSQSTESRAERGHLGSISLTKARRLFAAVDGRAELVVRWRGGEVDRLLDQRHATLVAKAAELLASWGWTVVTEVTFSVYGERGSIDLLAVQDADRVAAIFEMKATLASWEEAQRRFDVKSRLLPKIVFERLGWRPTMVGRFFVFEENVTSRRRLEKLGSIVRQPFPLSSRAVRAWLQRPAGPAAGIWFLSISQAGTRSRVRRPRNADLAARRPSAERGLRTPPAPRTPDTRLGSDS